MQLATSHLTVRYDDVLALSEVSLVLPAGTKLVVWGAAGSGKTSLLKALAGLVRPSAGHTLWGGKDLWALVPAERRALQSNIGMVFQSDALFDSMSVLENVLMPLRKRHVREDEAHERALEALTRVGLREAASKRPESLSGGMKKRCGVARAIVSRPTVLIADDPFAGLDPVTERSVAELLLEVSAGRTLIAALPDPAQALPADRLIHLSLGQTGPVPQ
jgi:phospholipid/cholesterol/gamma-HCH transport system ATP-binding protein